VTDMGRFSRYPAVNRDVPSRDTPTSPVSPPLTFLEDVQRVPLASLVDSATTPTAPESPLGDMTADEIIKWVGYNKSRARQALDEERNGRNRKGLISRLESRILRGSKRKG